MPASKRAALITKTHKVLAKHFKPVIPVERPVLEHLLYGCCLEDARYEVADECFARLQESFFDWNEVRVTTVRELSEIMRGLPDPARSANLLKQTLHAVFEAIYEFDLEALRKQNLGVAVKQLEQYRGTNPFTVAYVVQHALGGHAIPVCQGSLNVMYIVGTTTEDQLRKGIVPGLERAISKTKGVEFASLLHQIGAELVASPFSPQVRSILLEITPDAKNRLPKRGVRKEERVKRAADDAAARAARKTKAKRTPSPKKTAKPTAAGKKKSAASPAKKKTSSKKKSSSKSLSKKAAKAGKKSTSKQLARRKPR
jgi:endonuclease-3